MTRSRHFVRAALAAALIAIGALIAVPVGPVPVTLQLLAVAVATLVLSPAEVFAALGVYLMLGAFGAPVFSGGSAGVPVLLGPTGGFLWGFLGGAPLAAGIRRRLAGSKGQWFRLFADAASLLVLLATTYAMGLAQFAILTGRELVQAAAVAIAPFVLIDLGKCALAMIVARAVRSAGVAR